MIIADQFIGTEVIEIIDPFFLQSFISVPDLFELAPDSLPYFLIPVSIFPGNRFNQNDRNSWLFADVSI